AAVLSAEQFRMALRATIGSPRLQQLIPHLTDELVAEGFALARRTLTGWELAAAIKALADRMTPDLLREAARCASEIADIEDRSGVLALVLPKLRDMGITSAVSDAYRVAFVIGDRTERMVADGVMAAYRADVSVVQIADSVGIPTADEE